MKPPKPLTPAERQLLARRLLLERYVGHRLADGAPTPETMKKALVCLRLSKRLGIFKEYWDVMQATDVRSITVKNLEVRVHKGGRKKKGTPA